MRTYLRFNNLGKLIRDSGFNLDYVAGVCDISKSALSRYCKGDAIPKMDVGLKLCAALGCEFYDVWGKPYELVRKMYYVPDRVGYKVEDRYHNNLEYYRNIKGWTVKFMSHRCGINYITLKRYLDRKSVPNVADGLVLAMALDATVYDLFETNYINV